MKKLILILPVLLSVTLTNAQYPYLYIINDPDGYLNIREQPTVNSRVIDRIERYEIFFDARYFAGNDELYYNNYPSNWIPVCKEYNAPIGYVYKPNAIGLDEFRMLERNSNPYSRGWDSTKPIVCGNDTLQVVLTLKLFDKNAHEITYNAKNWIGTVDGKIAYALFLFEDGNAWEAESLTIFQKGKKISLPIDNFKNYYNPLMLVYVGLNDDLYICISCGDGGESYSICLSVVDGVIRYTKDTEAM